MIEELVDALSGLTTPATVGLSGRGGAGKSTLAAAAAARLDAVQVVAGDGFLVPQLCLSVSDDWSALDRPRLRRELLDPFAAGEPVRWRPCDWVDGLLDWQDLAPCDVLLVEGVGLIHPSLPFDLTVWLDTPAEVATPRGMARDRDQGAPNDDLWREVWAPTDAAYVARYRPEHTADLVLRP